MKRVIEIDYSTTEQFIDSVTFSHFVERAALSLDTLVSKSGRGNDFLGWMDLPVNADLGTIDEIKRIALEWRERMEAVVVIGIGGSYLGAKAVLEALSQPLQLQLANGSLPMILFAGHNISEEYLAELIVFLERREYGVVVVSKSGTTTEPAIAFRVLRRELEKKYGKEESIRRIIAVTDSEKGALRKLVVKSGYRSFVIPDDVGGRFSVLTPVALLPIALGGFNIDTLLEGAAAMRECTLNKGMDNPAIIYAALRGALYSNGKKIEILSSYNPKLTYIAEWWKQLFGESEGKEGKGIFPASTNFTTDLHSLGQYIQEGERTIFETVIGVNNSPNRIKIERETYDYDGLNYLAGRYVEECNKMAELGTVMAHVSGGVPNIRLSIDQIDEYHIGALLYFFEISCGISAYMLGVNPFDQPGVEEYKRNMYSLLGKPGF